MYKKSNNGELYGCIWTFYPGISVWVKFTRDKAPSQNGELKTTLLTTNRA